MIAIKIKIKRKKKSILYKLKIIGIVTLLSLLGSVVFISNYQMTNRLEAYKTKEAEITETLEKEQNRSKEIEEYKEYTKTDQFAEDIARERLHLVYPGEVVFMEKDPEK